MGVRRFGSAVWAPAARAGGVLWLEVTGVLFGMIAAVAAITVVQQRALLFHAGVPGRAHAWAAVAMLSLFGYFAVSSFARAWRRGRR